ncbi:DNA primase family protein [Halorientalis regularis]|uniref:Putative DNA primase/helicase n=1 Tax=Halorientalis regularis TaxID=660518 RepID=A0A1G7RM64_9EURY|nr:phage/plasmid primase, P4 family [Halorientalis regularis]SDG11832.1 putative DNA primase/helicase [Halorientalis regularis]
METENSSDDTASSDLGVCTDGENTQGPEYWRQQLVDADNNRERAYTASKWIRARGDIEPVEGSQLRAYNDDGTWSEDGTQALRERLGPILRENWGRRVLNKTKEQLLVDGLRDRDEFGMPSGKVAVENGLLDIQNGELREIRPDDRVLWKLPTEYDPEADCPRFRQSLREWLPDEGARKKVQEFVGYALDFNNTAYEVMLMLVGPTRTGKSTFLDVIDALFGADNTTSMSIQYLANEKWGVAELEDTPLNIRRDLDSSDIRKEGAVKELASGEPMKAERKGQDPYTIRPQTKHMFSANQVPGCDQTDDAFYNRWLMVKFNEQVPKDDRDENLDAKLTTSEELSGVLNWGLEGYQRLQRQGCFTAERSPEETRALWQKNGASIEQFIHEHVETDPNKTTPKEMMYAAYQTFAEEHGVTPEDKGKLTRKLTTLDGVDTRQRRFESGRKRVYEGVRLANWN